MNFAFLDKLKNWQIFLFFTVVIFIVYAQTLGFGFTYLDDNTLILDNLRFLSDPSNILQTFNQDVFHAPGSSAFYYRPLLTIYFMVGAFIGGQNPVIYHFLGLLIHLVAVFLLFIFLQKLEFNRNASFFVSLIFAVHPVLTQAVAWIPGVNDSLVTIFVLASFIFFIDYFNSTKRRYLVWHLFFWLCALFSKETAVFVPILFCLYFFLKINKIYTSDKNRGLSVFLSVVIGWLVIFIIWFLLRYQALGGKTLGMSISQALSCVYNNLLSVFLYIGKVMFPINLSVYPFLQDQTFIYGFVVTIALVILLYLNRRGVNWKNVVFGVAWFFVFLIPSLLRPNLQIVPDLLEHRIYLPIIGFIIIVLEINWKKIGEWLSCFIKLAPEKINVAILFLLLLILSFTTILHSRNFEDKILFWTDAVKNSPHAPLAHRNLGAMYWLDGRVDEAEKEYRESLKLNPDEHMAHNNLGLIYAGRGDFENAIKEYETELEINPYYGNALYNMGLAYWNMDKKDDAAEKWKETISTNPDYFDAYKGLIMYYQGSGEKELADKLLLELQRRGGL